MTGRETPLYQALLLCAVVITVMLCGACDSASLANSKRVSSRAPRVFTVVNNTRPTNGELLVIALPVGQGDSTLLVCPEHNGNVILFDMGSTQQGWSPDDVRAYLSQATLNGDRPLMDRVTTIIISHPDVDHFNYLPLVFPRPEQPRKGALPSQFAFAKASLKNSYETEGQKRSGSPASRAWKPADARLHVYISTTFDRFVRARKDGDVMRQWLVDVKAQTFNGGKPCFMKDCALETTFSERLCGGSSPVRFRVLAANLGRPQSNNEQSVVLSVTYHSHNVLLVGDFEKSALQNKLLKNVSTAMISADVYKISHHGAKAANGESWLKAIRPKMAFVSSAYPTERYGHPRCEALHITLMNMRPNTKSSTLHPIACGTFTSFKDPPKTTLLHIAKDVYSTSPLPNQICLLQIALSSQANIQPPQVVCWAHDYSKTRSHEARSPLRTRVNTRCEGCNGNRLAGLGRLNQLLATLGFG